MEQAEHIDDYEDPEDERLEREHRLQALGTGLERLAQEQVQLRQSIEDRWLKDLEQYHGKYDAKTQAALEQSEQSRVHINKTRSKTNTAEARISEMLLPTDDRNYGLQPTPVPELAQQAGDMTPVLDEAGQQIDRGDGQPLTKADEAKRIQKEARDAAGMMEDEIDDQLSEADYNAACRDIIHDSCLFGTGIIKGPIVVNRVRKSWKPQTDGERTLHILEMVKELRPGIEAVSVWNYFPDMSASTKDECEFEFERKHLTKKQLRKLADRPGYMPDQIRQILEDDDRGRYTSNSDYLSKMRTISGTDTAIIDNRFELWEYHGPIDKEDLQACGCEVDDDELIEYTGVVEFCGSIVIRAHVTPLETEESIYSVFNYEEDESGVFGFGVPYVMRSQAEVLNSGWRMMMDNGALSTAPMILIDRDAVEPADGVWEIKQRKLWYKSKEGIRAQDAFQSIEFPSHQAELAAIIKMASEIVDDETNLPMLAQGQLGTAPDTLGGMSMLLNSSNTVLRRVVKSFDDHITRPMIGRFYDWNMQQNPKEEIKGDYEVDARGSSALLVKETQQQALMQLMQFAGHPVFGPMTKARELYAKAVEAQHISPDEVIKSIEEIEALQQQQQAPEDPRVIIEQQKLAQEKQIMAAKFQHEIQLEQMRIQDRNAERILRLQEREVERQITMMKFASEQKISLDKIKADLAAIAMKERNSNEKFAVERSLKNAAGMTANYGLE